MQIQRHRLLASVAIGIIGLTAVPHFAPAQTAAPSTQPAVTLINIHLQQAVPEDVFAELTKQSGVKFTTNGNLWDQDELQTPIDVDIDHKPFWSAVKTICTMTGISMQPNYGMNNSGKQIMIQHFPGQEKEWEAYPSVETSGVFVQARGFNRQQNIDYGQKQNSQNYCNVQLFAYLDPALLVQTFNQNIRPDSVTDDAGNSLMPDRNSQRFYGGQQQRSLIYMCQVALKYPDHPGKTISDLKCTLQLRVGDKMDSLVVDNPLDAKEQSKTFGTMTIVFHSLKKSGMGYEGKIGISGDDDRANGNSWGTMQKTQLLDAKGHAFNFGGGGGGGGGSNGLSDYTVNYMSNGGDDNAGDPVKWMIELPSQTHQLKIPIEFKDLAIPQ